MPWTSTNCGPNAPPEPLREEDVAIVLMGQSVRPRHDVEPTVRAKVTDSEAERDR